MEGMADSGFRGVRMFDCLFFRCSDKMSSAQASEALPVRIIRSKETKDASKGLCCLKIPLFPDFCQAVEGRQGTTHPVGLSFLLPFFQPRN